MATWPQAKMAGRCAMFVLLGAGSGSCHRGPDPEIRIGVLTYVSGERRETSGKGTAEAALLAERLRDQAGGIRIHHQTYRIRLLIRDIGDRADRATSEARRLINEDSVVALIGPQFSRDAIPVASLAEQARIPMISPMSSHPRTTLGKQFVFRVAFVDDLQGAAMARFAIESLGARRAALLYDVAGEYNQNLAEVFRRAFEQAGGSIVADEQFTSDEAADFTPQLSRIAATHPDVIFSPNFIGPVSIQLMEARRLGIVATFLGTDSWDPQILGGLPEARGAYVSSQWHPGIGVAEADSFVARYRAEYGHEPLATAAATFDAVGLLLQAIESSQSLEANAIRIALAATTGYRGVTGVLNYDHGGNPKKSVFILRISDSGGVFQRQIDP